MKYGYARVSSTEQETALQLDALSKAGVDHVSQEKRSARKARPILTQLLASLVTDDELIVYKVDRIARSIRDLAAILDQCASRGIRFRSLTEPFDTTTPAGRMMVQLLGIVAEFEWHMIRDRSMAGQAAAAARGVKIGRRRSLTEQQEADVYQALKEGRNMSELGREYGVHMSCIKRAKLRIDRPSSPAVARRFG